MCHRWGNGKDIYTSSQRPSLTEGFWSIQSFCPLAESLPVPDGEELTLRYILSGMDGVYMADIKKARVLFQWLDRSKEMSWTVSLVLLLCLLIQNGQRPEAVPHQVRLVIVEFGFAFGGFVPVMPYYGEDFKIIGVVPSVAVSVEQMILASDDFGPTGKQRNCLQLLPGSNGAKAGIWAGKALLLFNPTCPTNAKEIE